MEGIPCECEFSKFPGLQIIFLGGYTTYGQAIGSVLRIDQNKATLYTHSCVDIPSEVYMPTRQVVGLNQKVKYILTIT